MKKRAFTLVEVMIVVAVVALLSAIAIPKMVKVQQHQLTTVSHKIVKEGGGDGMFRFIELLGIVILLWFIVNFVHYALWATTGMGGEGEGGFWFAMSNSWIKQAKNGKKEKKK